MKRYVIERDLPGVGGMTGPQLGHAAATSNDALAKLGGKAQWIQSYVAANKMMEISGIIDPMTAGRS